MNETPRANRLHIALFGRRNVGKSSLINALTGQEVAIVSDVAGTTTDPVQKAMEILPLGPVIIIDTAGLDDEGALGELRVKKSLDTLRRADLVLLVLNAKRELGEYEYMVVEQSRERNLPVIAVANKNDENPLSKQLLAEISSKLGGIEVVATSATSGDGINALKIALVKNTPADWDDVPLVGDLLQAGDTVILVVPIDTAAPKGRLILPQVQILRDILDSNCIAVVVKENELANVLAGLNKPPRLVICDSQVFAAVNAVTPKDVELTSFSILFARYKGDLDMLVAGATAIDDLKAGDKVLISEACTHHRMQDDIGTVKIPSWLNRYVGGELDFSWTSGLTFQEDLSKYKLVVHCGACMINRKEMLSRLMEVEAAGVAVVNYGVAIAHVHGILKRVLSPFPELQRLLR